MPDDNEMLNKGSAAAAGQTAGAKNLAPAVAEDQLEHYEQIAEYRIGEGPPPLALVIMFVLIVCWATLSWIPFFGY
jgi:hypothetical protein